MPQEGFSYGEAFLFFLSRCVYNVPAGKERKRHEEVLQRIQGVHQPRQRDGFGRCGHHRRRIHIHRYRAHHEHHQPVIAGGGADTISGLVVPGTDIDFGAFISACINFLIVAFVVFLLVKAVNKAQDLGNKLTGKEEEAPKAEPVCPYCLEEVKEGATRCPHCAGVFDAPAKAK